ncbi:hypothetical protein [Halococcus saccharolyticus]|uniref:Uncharacterized protein n=1 Tax=Halococcus saccharolyticus DSM 5350 TaxID=1227455 RepID=M0MFG0_9EURY|nr:hypothetical protein [Halococcus saccharolyticus]EMA44441.1 hypothetical protein C449_10548 [Halococcus saccharolyticus DSM 5350]
MAATRSIRLPTRARDWRLMARTARLVVTIPLYAAIALVAAVCGLTLFVLSQNLPLAEFLIASSLPLDSRLIILTEQYPFIGTNYGPLQGLLLIVTAVLIGVNVAMVIYHLREHALSAAQGTTSVAGVVLGTLGAGCAACGSAVLAGVLSLFGVTASLTVLPFDGLEFAALALVALVFSVFWLARGMRGGEINGCPVDLD